MKIEKNIVYFEDVDTPEVIKNYFLKLQQKESELEANSYGETNNYLKQLSIDELIKQVKGFNFIVIDGIEKNKVLEILDKEKNTLDNSFNVFFETKISAFLSLIDYIVRNNEEYPHLFKYDSEKTCYIGCFQGIFGEELTNIQTILGENPFSFYVYKTNDEKIKLPKIDFNSSLNKIFLTIKNNFISDYEPNNFGKIYKNYLKFKNSNHNEDKREDKFKP